MTKISSNELRAKYLKYFADRGHKVITGSSLIPTRDPTVLFTTAGMHPLVPYLRGQSHPQGPRLTSVQRCLRTTDIELVGDETHATVFEMLGNWSLGDYGKKEAIELSWTFLTGSAGLNIDPKKLAVSVFAGDKDAARDEEAAAVWRSLGVPASRIAFLGNQDNWWPAGGQELGLQGPDTEMFYWTGTEAAPAVFDPQNELWVEIWNDVFMEFEREEGGRLKTLKQKNVDTGMGLERTVMILNGVKSIYEIDTYLPLMTLLTEGSYFHVSDAYDKKLRVVADHLKAATFIMTDEAPVVPGNTEQGYVLRRLIRRGVVTARLLGATDFRGLFQEGMEIITQQYESVYTQMRGNLDKAQEAVGLEITKFERSLNRGLKKFVMVAEKSPKMISGDDALLLLQSYGFPLEITMELARERGLTVDSKGFREKFVRHQETSRMGSTQKFSGGLADHSEKSRQYHTATHLLHAALRQVLGTQVTQKGSNITEERLRFDFNHDRKLTAEELASIEALVNQAINDKIAVEREEISLGEAKTRGAIGLFEEKYGKSVSIYKIGTISLEICGGPHVENTSELGVFSIIKEEASSAGVRRIKAILT
jgi:alanyl-tRNA synthetase